MPIDFASRAAVISVICIGLAASAPLNAADRSLIRINRSADVDRNTLLSKGVVLVSETNDAWFAIGDIDTVSGTVGALSLTAERLIGADEAEDLVLIAPWSDLSASDLAVCGHQIASGEGWHLVWNPSGFSAECFESPSWFIRRLDLDPMRPEKAPPIRWAGFADGSESIVPDPLVQEMVDAIDVNVALSHWQALSESPNWDTRYSPSQGCFDASAYVHALFSAVGLEAVSQQHTSGWASNVIGTLRGSVSPDEIYIAIAHLDDLPSFGSAPGANDNASGSAMVTAAAEVMAGYCFESTVRFLTVTGEEQGLYGSDHYADQAAAAGENILGVLNGDMTGWQGDEPAVEDLDIIYNPASAWMAQLMIDAAADYGTGMTINGLNCPGMGSSDHWPFWQNGYSAICGITDDQNLCGSGGLYPHYHQSSDTIFNCGPGAPDFETAAIRTYVATLAHLAQPIARVPLAPTGLTAQADGANRIALAWLPQDPGTEIQIYRAPGGCLAPGPFTMIGSTTGTSFTDTGASGGVPYAYTVVAAAASTCTSEASLCVDASTTGACTEAPLFVGVETVVNPATADCRLELGWQPPDEVWCGGPVGYNVYRSGDPSFIPSPVNRVAADVAATAWTDHDVVFGSDYHYIVRAVDQGNAAEDSNTARVSGAPTGPAVIGTWIDDAGDSVAASLEPTSPWSIVPAAGVTGAAYATGPYSSNTCSALTSPALLLASSPELSFQSRFDIEAGWDKGELQISTDGASTWNRVPMSYPGGSSHDNDACGLGEGAFFTGTIAGYTSYTADLETWAGQEVRLRWLFSSDGLIEADGWWIDDLSITDVAVPASCSSDGVIFFDDFESGDTSAWSR
jgi:hypothetical protein